LNELNTSLSASAMNPILRNVLAVLVGASVCLLLNGLLLGQMMALITTPEGFDPTKAYTYHLLEPVHYLSPFLAHALPSLVGGLIAALLAAHHSRSMALIVGGLHLLGGIAAAFMIPAPTLFIASDLVVAYLPMAWLGWRLSRRGA
jgi:hypothetical protein